MQKQIKSQYTGKEHIKFKIEIIRNIKILVGKRRPFPDYCPFNMERLMFIK